MIDRTIEPILVELSKKYSVITITGPRQSGKTTLCRKVFPDKQYANLESPDVRQFANNDPRGFLNQYKSGVILDEIQRVPQLLSYIQGIVDEKKAAGQFILTGSQQFEVSNAINQSLAGRTAILKLLPLSISEVQSVKKNVSIDMLIFTGFYPRVYDQKLNPTQALGDYLETYVERDIRQIAAIKDLSLFEKFIKLCAGRTGQLVNLQSLANDTGISHTTARAWLTLLEASYVIFMLQPWYKNVSKRLIKSPKIYFYDVGLASYLLGLENELHVQRDPLIGNLFENLAVIEALKYRFNKGLRNNLNFYRDNHGNEIDLIFRCGPDVFPVEVKAGATITDDYIREIGKCKKIFTKLPWQSGLVYGGSEIQMRSDFKVYPVTKMQEMLDSVGGVKASL